MNSHDAYRPLLVLSLCLALAGCSTSKEKLMPHGGRDMADIWRQGAGGHDSLSQRALYDARADLRRPLPDGAFTERRVRHTRTAANEIYNTFGRLPNPDLVMFVFPHLAGNTERVPVPGYSTVFPLYRTPQYALPGDTAQPSVESAIRTGRTR